MRRITYAAVAAVLMGSSLVGSAWAEDGKAKVVTLPDGCVSQEGAKYEGGKWVLPDGTPTFHICKKDGTIVTDWATYNGYRRYHSECHVCHGPNALGSSYAPALANSLKTPLLLGFPRHRRQRPRARRGGNQIRDAGVRRQQERYVLHQRSL